MRQPTSWIIQGIRLQEEDRRRARQRAVELAAIILGIAILGYFWLMWAIYGELP